MPFFGAKIVKPEVTSCNAKSMGKFENAYGAKTSPEGWISTAPGLRNYKWPRLQVLAKKWASGLGPGKCDKQLKIVWP